MSRKRLTYEEPAPVTAEELTRLLAVGSREELQSMVVSVALLESDFEYALSVVLQCARASDAGIRSTAILCLGHLARIHRRLPELPAFDLVKAGLLDDDFDVRGQSQNAADDIEMFIPSARGKLGGNL